MRENILLVSYFYGLNKEEIKEQFNKIVEFSGLKEFLDVRVYQFSSGMMTRLSFSITLFCLEKIRPNILLLDEIFGAGGVDLDFEAKSLEKIEKFVKEGITLVVAGHDLDKINNYCNRVILLDNGKILTSGNPQEVISYYKSL